MDNNAYLLRCRADGTQVLIDAANDAPTLLELIGPAGLATVVTTHQHGDHTAALTEVVKATGARVDRPHRRRARRSRWSPARSPTATPSRSATAPCEVIHIVGHTPGSIVLLYQEPDGTAHLWTGDSLFPGGVGNTRGNKKNFAVPDRRRGDQAVRPASRTTPGSTRATARTRRWARNARPCPSGAPAAGDSLRGPP